MPRIALVAGGLFEGDLSGFDHYVGVDAGSLVIVAANLPLSLAVGDFDSVTPDQLALIEGQAGQLIQSAAEKNDTDTELALKAIFDRWPQAQVTLFGVLGGRLDHSLSAIFLPSDPELFPYLGQLRIVDACNQVTYYPAGKHTISPLEGMAYVSFMTEEDGELTITNAKYPLNSQQFFKKKIYLSNVFLEGPIQVSLTKGYLLVIHSKDRK